MAIKKSQLYSTLWESCNALRGSMDASQYKDYVLIVLFVKYLSDKARQHQTRLVIPQGCAFDDFVALKQNDHIGEEINKKLEAIKEANRRIIGDLVLPNFNDATKLGQGRSMVKALSDLVGVFENDALDFSKNRAADDDLLGDAYEYLMKNFAAESGKSKGQFYTPAEVSRIMAKVLGLGEFERARDTIYDPTCGSGSLLLRALGETPNRNVSLRGQEKDATTASLAKLNMLLHGIVSAEIAVGDTLNDPKFKDAAALDTFDVCVANPPFSVKNWLGDAGADDPYGRWRPDLLPPAKNGDYAFLLHLVRSMKDTPGHEGRGACILPHGVLFRGNAEADIRRDLVSRHLVEGVIGLPPNLFFGTGIPASILVLNKRDAAARKGVFFIDAKDGFMKDGPKNRLREQDIRRIVDAWDAYRRGRDFEIPHFSHFATWQEIEKNDFNLNIPRYVAARDASVSQDLDGHLRGGVSSAEVDSFAREWASLPEMKDRLFAPLRPGYLKLNVAEDTLADALAGSASARDVAARAADSFRKWCAFARSTLDTHAESDPKATISVWSNAAFKEFAGVSPMIDPYDVYGAFMDYANDTLRDDLYVLHADGWLAAREIVVAKRTKSATVWDGALVPKSLVAARFFPERVADVAAAQSAAEQADAALERFLDEEREKGADSEILDISPEDDADDAKPYPDKELKKRRGDRRVAEFFRLKDAASKARATLRAAEAALDDATRDRYATLTEDEIRTLLFDDKWFAALGRSFAAIFDTALRSFATSLAELAARYRRTLPELESATARSRAEVHSVLKELGFCF